MVLEEGYAARSKVCKNRSASVQIKAHIASRRRYREYSVPHGMLCACGMRTPRPFWANGFQGVIHRRILEEINGL